MVSPSTAPSVSTPSMLFALAVFSPWRSWIRERNWAAVCTSSRAGRACRPTWGPFPLLQSLFYFFNGGARLPLSIPPTHCNCHLSLSHLSRQFSNTFGQSSTVGYDYQANRHGHNLLAIPTANSPSINRGATRG